VASSAGDPETTQCRDPGGHLAQLWPPGLQMLHLVWLGTEDGDIQVTYWGPEVTPCKKGRETAPPRRPWIAFSGLTRLPDP
jgi:hypothetical protein